MTFPRAVVIAVMVFGAGNAYAAPHIGGGVFSDNFDSSAKLKMWEGADNVGVRLEAGRDNTQCLRIDRPATAGAGSAGVRTRFSDYTQMQRRTDLAAHQSSPHQQDAQHYAKVVNGSCIGAHAGGVGVKRCRPLSKL